MLIVKKKYHRRKRKNLYKEISYTEVYECILFIWNLCWISIYIVKWWLIISLFFYFYFFLPCLFKARFFLFFFFSLLAVPCDVLLMLIYCMWPVLDTDQVKCEPFPGSWTVSTLSCACNGGVWTGEPPIGWRLRTFLFWKSTEVELVHLQMVGVEF